jgi:hypothetical protein
VGADLNKGDRMMIQQSFQAEKSISGCRGAETRLTGRARSPRIPSKRLRKGRVFEAGSMRLLQTMTIVIPFTGDAVFGSAGAALRT